MYVCVYHIIYMLCYFNIYHRLTQNHYICSTTLGKKIAFEERLWNFTLVYCIDVI